jgi:short-subunit dehydrogenase
MHLTDKIIWLTGASEGIGKAIATQLAQKGAKLVLSARRTDLLENVAQSLQLADNQYLILPFDLGDASTNIDLLTQQVIAKFGRIDCLINNAGISQKAFALPTSEEVERKIMEINFFGNIRLTKSVIKAMQTQGEGGKIVVVSSIIGKFGAPYLSTYAASKHAVNGYYESLRYEVEKDNISVLIASPGFIKTNIASKAITETGGEYAQDSVAQKNGTSAETCARKIIRAIENEKRDFYVGKLEIWMPRFKFFFPRLFYFILKKLHQL